ncbi:prepilin-type N-terminal cleavage/methylation domain-containing protein [Anaeromicropila populeti]|uniref:Prepilin-type N-terminal cleavage/methylation domain-containing protein n=1 Tax=Anaeromicropila populeti TaxID=37658 RepID=A0A1I6IP92_9FIRM|nr:prepilin-type N-terminal cleavage/methylation domain-containing protein [Anaeromicropila populeti]SFR68439.1 prepilin-type N-terminal cleavage/methylation domain-containing protein [Anaeromicropila populeti]
MKFRKNKKGFSLVEVMVSVMVLAILFIPIISNFVASIKVNREAGYMQKATLVAQTVLEDVKNKTYEEFLKASGWTTQPVDPSDTAALIRAKAGFIYDGVEYKAEVRMTPTSYYGTGGVDSINDKKLPKIYAMSSNNTCVMSDGYDSSSGKVFFSNKGYHDDSKLRRTMKVTIEKLADKQYKVSVEYEYTYDGCIETLPLHIYEETFMNGLDCIYFYYQPLTSGNDTLKITCDTVPATDHINFFVISTDTSVSSQLTIDCPTDLCGSASPFYMVHNVNFSDGHSNEVATAAGDFFEEETKDRLYRVTVKVTRANDVNNKVYAEMSSAKGEN